MRGLDPGAFDAQGTGSIPIARLERRLGLVETAILQRQRGSGLPSPDSGPAYGDFFNPQTSGAP